MQDTLEKMVLAYIYGQHSEVLAKIAESKEDSTFAALARYLLGQIDQEKLDDVAGADASVVRKALKAAFREATRGIDYYYGFDPAAVRRLGDLANWRSEYTSAEGAKASFAQAVYILLHQPEYYVNALARGDAPRCPMMGNHFYAEAAIALAKVHPVWGQLASNQTALVAFARWRAGVDTGNGSTHEFMQALKLRPEELTNETLVALATLEPSSWAWHAGHRWLKVPHLTAYGQQQWVNGQTDNRIRLEAPDVVAALEEGRGRIALGDAAMLCRDYQDNPFVRGWIEEHVADEHVDNPADPFGPKVSAWGLKKAQLGL